MRAIYLYRFFLLAVMLLVNICRADAQYSFDRFINIGGEEVIRGRMVEGDDGFIWIGTANGLYRYDGRNFKIYRHDPADSTSLQGDHIYSILAVDDHLWLGTNYGVSIFNLSTQTFKNYTFSSADWLDWGNNYPYNRVTSFYEDQQGEIWIGTKSQGLWRFDAENETFIPYSERNYPTIRPSIGEPYTIFSISQFNGNDSTLWVGTIGGILEVNKYTETQRLHVFQDENTRKEKAVNTVLEVFTHTDGLIYLGNWTEGVYTFNPQTGDFKPIEVENDVNGLLQKTYTRAFYPYSEELFWISTSKGVVLYNSRLKTIVYSKANNFEEKAFFGVSLIDKRNRYWYNTNFGIYLFDPHMQQFEEISYRHLYSKGAIANTFYLEYDSIANHLIICPRQADGIYHYNLESSTWVKHPIDFPKKVSSGVYGFAVLAPDKYLLLTLDGLFSYHVGTDVLDQIKLPKEINPNNLRAVLIDSNGEIWIGANNDGVFRTDRSFRHFKRYQEELSYTTAGINQVDNFFEDSRQNIWIKRQYGFSVYDRQRDTMHNFIYQLDPQNSFEVANAFTEDHQGRIWTANGAGQVGYMEAAHPELGLVNKMDIGDQGISGFVHILATDTKGNIWAVTPDDIIRIDPVDLSMENFSFRYGAKDFSFFSFRILPNDEMYLGSHISLIRTNPVQLKKNDELPIPYLSSLSIRNVKEQGPYPLFGKEPLRLKYHENFFTLFYSAQAYTLGDKVSFRYRLKGFDDWNEVGNSQIATYTNVSSGDYTFELQAANNDGVWNEEALTIPITVNQPWYASWWFYLSGAIFVGLFVFSVYQYRVNQIRNEARIKTDYDKKLASVEMNALLAQMNPHFIFNSLNSIDSFILKNESQQASEYLNDFARLIRLILQHSRSESILLSSEIETLELYLKMEQLRFKDRFDYIINIDESVDIDQIEIPPMLVQPYVENAVWHGIMHLPENHRGELLVDFQSKDDVLTIQVTDNGVGRVRSREIKQRKIKHKQSMGMKITHDRIELINTLYNANARIDIADLYNEDEQPKGTKVFITIST